MSALSVMSSPYPVRDDRPSGELPWLTVLIGCYGDFHRYSGRALDSVVFSTNQAKRCDVIVGLNDCGRATIDHARSLLDQRRIDAVTQSNRNLNKDPMFRVLLEQVRTPYAMWMDDDSYFVTPDWAETLTTWIAQAHSFDVAGRSAYWGPERMADPVYAAYVRDRPWWCESDRPLRANSVWLPFVLGGVFVARTEFLRTYQFPDRGMTKALDDVLLGELVDRKHGRMLQLPAHVLDTMRINDGVRRGENFLLVEDGPY